MEQEIITSKVEQVLGKLLLANIQLEAKGEVLTHSNQLLTERLAALEAPKDVKKND